MRSSDRTPVADAEEPRYSSSSFDSPTPADSSPQRPKPTVDFNALMLDHSQMKRPHRSLHVVIAFIGETLFFAIMILVPLLYTHTINLSEFQNTYLVAPPAPPPPPPPPRAVVRQQPFHMQPAKLYQPVVIPKKVVIVKDQQQPAQTAPGVTGGVFGGIPGGQLGGVLGGILGGNHQVVAPPPPPAHHGPYRVGGKIQAPRLIHNVRPLYPPLAKQARVSGNVVVDCVIDEHGNIVQAHVVSGHPLLVQAALEAVQQWKYQPTQLNGRPVAVKMAVTVEFSLGEG